MQIKIKKFEKKKSEKSDEFVGCVIALRDPAEAEEYRESIQCRLRLSKSRESLRSRQN